MTPEDRSLYETHLDALPVGVDITFINCKTTGLDARAITS